MGIDLDDLEVMYYCGKSEIEQQILALRQTECQNGCIPIMIHV